MRAVVDTNILIDHLRGIEAARAELARYAPPLISPITWVEVMAGASDDNERSQLRQFLDRFELLALSPDVMELAAKLRRDSGLKLPDALILAAALEGNYMLVTRNTKDFDPAAWANVRVPYVV